MKVMIVQVDHLKERKKKSPTSRYCKKLYVHSSNVDVPFEIGHYFMDATAFRDALRDCAVN